ncbi:MAG: ABC transporter ATP-binding protein [Alphaproteobacteria bacterium]|nr:ABC transporter ATP-binding protein [Alphaproteobacteria bacterium]
MTSPSSSSASASAEVVAHIEGLVLTYGRTAVLDGIDLDVRAGEVLGLMGPNGGGKSTLLLTLAGLIRPTAGSVRVQGTPAHRLALDATGKVGLITTTPGLYPLLTGRENLAFFGALYGLSAAEVEARTAGFVDRLGLRPHLDKPASTGSSGMQQKLSIARALLMDPPLLLLDEPTANLDPVSADVIYQTARAHADAGKAVVWVTHDLHAAEAICDRVALVRQRVLHVASFTDVRQPPAAGPLLAAWRRILGDTL